MRGTEVTQPIHLTVFGKPEPRGSKVPIVLYDRATGKPRLDPRGKVILFPKDDNPRSKPWMTKVARAARAKFGELKLAGPLELRLRFYLARPGYHFGTGRNAGVIKPQFANARHTVRPDRLKLARAVEDALTGVLYVDDAQTCAGPVEKHYCPLGTEPCVEIELVPIVDEPAKAQAPLFGDRDVQVPQT